MTESTDLIAKKATLQALEASIALHIRRAEELNIEYQKLGAEIDAQEQREQVIVA